MPDFLFHVRLEIWIAGGLVFIGVYPVLLHLLRGWVIKRDDIFSSLNTPAKDRYLENFQAREASQRTHKVSADEEFKSLYNSRYGRWNYIVPTVLLVAVLVPTCYLMSITGFTQLNILS